MDHAALLALLLTCAPQVDSSTAQALIGVESATNPNAIGVVGGVLERQPRRRAEAVATAKALQAGGWNFSVGLAQINVHNMHRLGLDLASAFEPCANLAAMQFILVECFERANRRSIGEGPAQQRRLREALSCYYSGNFNTGLSQGYVKRLVAAAAQAPLNPVTRQEVQ
jgi:type IV secretion system protein VirB1